MAKKRRKKIISYVLLVLIAVFLTFPFFWMLSTSFKGPENLFSYPPEWIPKNPTLDNYRAVFAKIPIFRYFLNTVIITALGVTLNIVLSSMAAYPLGRMNFWGRNFIFSLIIAPMLIPLQGTIIINYMTLRELNLVNKYLGVVITSAVSIFGVFLLKQAYAGVPKEIEEAARIDGCGEFRLWWQIMLPMVKPSLAAVSIFSFVGYWNLFMWPLIVLKDKALYPLSVGLTALESTFESNFRYISAGAVISIIPILIFFYFTQRYFIEGYKGAVKG